MATTLQIDLDRSSPVPLYFQVAQVFEKAIMEGLEAEDPELVEEILRNGARRAQTKGREVLERVRTACGLRDFQKR